MSKKIGIIGCGWLGLPLAEELSKAGHQISGTTTTEEKLSLLKEKHIVPYQISISEEHIKGPITGFLKPLSILIVNIPPGLRGKGPKESYVAKIKLLHREVKKSGINKVIFVSSTSVYGGVEGIVTEESIPEPTTESGKQLLQCENLFKNDPNLSTTLIRFGGLIGPDRHPITLLSGRTNLKGGNASVNLIHLDDCIGIIKAVVENAYWNKLINAVYPDHPTKEQYYTREALKRGLKPPSYEPNTQKSFKLITTCSPFLNKKYEFLTSIN